MSNYIIEHILYPIFVNITSPLILFGLGFCFMKSKWINKKVCMIYTTVKNNLEINNDTEVASSPVATTTTTNHSQNNDSNSINKISKDYGSDEGWSIRTFYTILKKQIFEYESINFKIRSHDDLNIEIKTKWLINQFGLDSSTEKISDAAGKIRIYIYQEKGGNKKFYIVRFGSKALEKPIKLTQDNSIIKQQD